MAGRSQIVYIFLICLPFCLALSEPDESSDKEKEPASSHQLPLVAAPYGPSKPGYGPLGLGPGYSPHYGYSEEYNYGRFAPHHSDQYEKQISIGPHKYGFYPKTAYDKKHLDHGYAPHNAHTPKYAVPYYGPPHHQLPEVKHAAGYGYQPDYGKEAADVYYLKPVPAYHPRSYPGYTPISHPDYPTGYYDSVSRKDELFYGDLLKLNPDAPEGEVEVVVIQEPAPQEYESIPVFDEYEPTPTPKYESVPTTEVKPVSTPKYKPTLAPEYDPHPFPKYEPAPVPERRPAPAVPEYGPAAQLVPIQPHPVPVYQVYKEDEVTYGAETGPYGAFRWFADYPVGKTYH